MEEIFEVYGHAIISMIAAVGIVVLATYFFMYGPLAEKIAEALQLYT